MITDYRFASAEMAILMQHVWTRPLPAADTLQDDLGVDAGALDAARQALLQRQWLLPAPDRSRNETFVSPALWPVIATAARPAAVGVLEITAPAQPARSLYFTWTPQRMVANWVDEHGEHVLQVLDGPAAFADAAVRACGLEDFAPAAEAALPDDPEVVAQQATLRGLYVAAVNLPLPQEAEQAGALTWLVSGGQLWLMRPTPGHADASLGPASVDEVRAAVIASTEQAIAAAEAALAAEV
jgi:hypothetical protein